MEKENPEKKRIANRKATIKRMLAAMPRAFVEEGVVKMSCEDCDTIMICERSSKKVCAPCQSKRDYKKRDKIVLAEKNKKYKENNPEKVKQYAKKRYAENKEQSLATSKEYRKNHREDLKQKNKEWNAANRESQCEKKRKAYAEKAEYYKEFKRNERANWTPEQKAAKNAYRRQRWPIEMADIQKRLRNRLRHRILEALKAQNESKRSSSQTLVGCQMIDLRLYIEAQFQPGMTWDNIHIDHIIPCASFDLSDIEQQRRCFHFSNLQPLLAVENLQKGSSVSEEDLILNAVRWIFERQVKA